MKIRDCAGLVAATLFGAGIAPAHATVPPSVPLYLTVDGGWTEFLATTSLGWVFPEVSAPYENQILFTLDAPAYLRVTDLVLSGDVFQVNINGDLFSTSAPGSVGDDTGTAYEAAFASPLWSHGQWLLGPGSYAVSGQLPTSPTGGTSGAISLVSEASAAVPEPATWLLMIAGFCMTGAALRRRPSFA